MRSFPETDIDPLIASTNFHFDFWLSFSSDVTKTGNGQ